MMVPYKSTTDAQVDLMANRIQIWFTPIASGIPVRDGSAGPHTAVTGEHGHACCRYPDVEEAGYPDLTVDVAYFPAGGEGTPQRVVDKPPAPSTRRCTIELMETLLAEGVEEKRGTPSEVAAYLAGEVRRWGDIVKLSAIGCRRKIAGISS